MVQGIAGGFNQHHLIIWRDPLCITLIWVHRYQHTYAQVCTQSHSTHSHTGQVVSILLFGEILCVLH